MHFVALVTHKIEIDEKDKDNESLIFILVT